VAAYEGRTKCQSYQEVAISNPRRKGWVAEGLNLELDGCIGLHE
jgi:hypothetical protein